MRKRICKTGIVVAVWLMMSASVWAACGGTDLRPTLSDKEREAMAEGLANWPYATGNLWRATRDGQTLNIIGTMHLADDRFDARLPELSALVASADLLMVEATLEQSDRLKSRLTSEPDLMFRIDGPTLPDLMDEADWQKLASMVRERGLPVIMAAKMQPWFLTTFLAMPPCMLEAMNAGAEGLDFQLMHVAADAGVATVGLEPEDTLFRIFDTMPLDLQIDMLRLSMSDVTGSEDMLATSTKAYFEERHGELWMLSQVLAGREPNVDAGRIQALTEVTEQFLLTDRNLAWIDQIAARDESVITIAVGAAHLGGPDGVLPLLEARGYRLERLPF